MNKVKEQVVVVGGTKGLGRVVVDRFLARGHSVTVLSRHAISSSHANVNHVSIDLENLKDLDALRQTVLNISDTIKYLIFCQRYRGQGDAWAGEMQVTLTATNKIITLFADDFLKSGDAAIGIVSSVYANFVGGSQEAGYHVAKAGLNQLVKYYAWTMGKKGVRVNSIMPLTYLKNESKEYYLAQKDLMKLYKDFVPLKRMGDAEDSANLIDFLCSDKASFINGQSIFVDGGTSVIWPEELAKSLTGL